MIAARPVLGTTVACRDAAEFTKVIRGKLKWWAEMFPAEVFREAAFEMGKEVVDGTPVLTGQAANSWVMGIGSPANSPNPPILDVARHSGLSLMYEKSRALKISDLACITSECSYIGYLEYGTEKMAPVGMLRTAIAHWPRIVIRACQAVRSGEGWK